MKRLIVLAALCAFAFSATVASAVDVKLSGQMLTSASWQSDFDFDPANRAEGSNFDVTQRAEIYFTATANEHLKAVLGMRVTDEFGDSGFAMGAADNNLVIRDAYLDFNWPGTSVNAILGYKGLALPNAFNSSFLLDTRVSQVAVSTDLTDNVSVMAAWARLDNFDAAATESDAAIDAWVLSVPVAFEGVSVTPFGAYVPFGEAATPVGNDDFLGLAAVNSSDDATYDDAYWLGVAFEMDMFDPFVVKADVNYGTVSGEQDSDDRSGWLAAAALEYTGFDFMTPELYFVYTSGEDGNSTEGDGDSERLPTLAGDFSPGSFFFGGGSMGIGDDLDDERAQNGFWVVGLSLTDIASFAEGLSHNVHFLYAQGTNDEDSVFNGGDDRNLGLTYGRTLTEEDSLIEVSTQTQYSIYDELTLYLDLAYANLDAEEDVWGNDNEGGDAYKVSGGIVYKF